MKRPVITAVFLCALAGLAGCPIYDHQSAGCYRTSDCAQSYVCDVHSGACYLPNDVACASPLDCDATATCTPSGQCLSGDCSFYGGCVAGFRCDSSTGVWQCVAIDTGAAGASSEAGAAAGGAAGQAGMSSSSSGAADGASGGVAGIAGGN